MNKKKEFKKREKDELENILLKDNHNHDLEMLVVDFHIGQSKNFYVL
jgi:hypothetical protein